MVGLGRFELPTSRLSSARSNQLSYRPNHVTHVGNSMSVTLAPATGDRGHISANDLAAWARPRRKRNEDGEVPPMDLFDLTSNDPCVFLKRSDRDA